MVIVDLPAKLTCEEPGCIAETPATLCLMPPGVLGFQPASALWQLYIQNQTGPFMSRCPLHALKVQTVQKQVGPAGPRMVPVGRPE